MKNYSNTYIFLYISILVIVIVSLLSLLTLGLKPRQEANKRADQAMQILRAAGYQQIATSEAANFFDQVATSIATNDGTETYSIRCADGSRGRVVRVDGKGLWGPIWGYVVVAEDGNTIKGVTFAHKSETPGLGANITEERFTSQFVGKQLRDMEGNFTSVRVLKKGKSPEVADANRVDAISGATLTSKGVDEMLLKLNADNQ